MDDRQMHELQVKYKRVFSGPDGYMVLADILALLGFCNNVPDRIDPKCIAVANTILSRLDVFGRDGIVDYVARIISGANPVHIIPIDRRVENEKLD